MASADERFCLRVRNLPAVLSPEAITSLLSHYGATRVRVLQRRNAASSGKEPGATAKRLQKAIAIFATREAQQNAQRRLNLLELAGHHLQVEVVGDDAATTETEAQPKFVETGNKFPLNWQPPLPPTPPPMQNPLYAPAPLAPHLGLHYAPSPLLEYKYPKATESIVRNIANALIALPRFYTQVLHLMNKMNLPLPFDEDAIPGRFSVHQESVRQDSERVGSRKYQLKRRRTDENANVQIVEEDEDDREEGVNSKHPENDHNCSRGSEELPPPPPLQLPTEGASFTTTLGDPTADRKACDISSQLDGSASRAVVLGIPFSRQNKGLAIQKSTALQAAFQLGGDTSNTPAARRPTRPGVISENEVKRLRLAPQVLQEVPLMATYLRGSPSADVVVKNIAHTVDEIDLRYVFNYVLPLNASLDSLIVTFQPGQNSAVITYCDEGVATSAVDELHGLQLEGKALIVNFQNTSEVMPTVQCLTVEELASKRLPESQLALEKTMKKYQRGEPSDTLYVKNLAKTVELADLCAVFGSVLPPESGPDSLNVRHFTTGRMKCQAFVKYPTAKLASCALDQVHGVVLKDKPMIVCFRKPQTS